MSRALNDGVEYLFAVFAHHSKVKLYIRNICKYGWIFCVRCVVVEPTVIQQYATAAHCCFNVDDVIIIIFFFQVQIMISVLYVASSVV